MKPLNETFRRLGLGRRQFKPVRLARKVRRSLDDIVYGFRNGWRRRYRNPSEEELWHIEDDLVRIGENVIDYHVAPDRFQQFLESAHFPET